EVASQLQRQMRKKSIRFNRMGYMEVGENEQIINYPVKSIDTGLIAGFQLFINYKASKVEVLGVSTSVPKAHLEYNVIESNNEILTTWIAPDYKVDRGDTLLNLLIKLKGKPNDHIDNYFEINTLQYVVSSVKATTILGWKIALPQLEIRYTDDSLSWEQITDSVAKRDSLIYENETPLITTGQDITESKILNVIPNPFKAWADITYSVANNSVVNLKLYSLLGEEILTIVDGERQTGLYRRNISGESVAAGVYVLRLETSHDGKIESDVVKVIIKK
ncbi:MAG: T9SS type A sorting domain-containing protein, partial [Bacteroidales bacterium]